MIILSGFRCRKFLNEFNEFSVSFGTSQFVKMRSNTPIDNILFDSIKEQNLEIYIINYILFYSLDNMATAGGGGNFNLNPSQRTLVSLLSPSLHKKVRLG